MKVKICYRCGIKAVTEFMGLPYCRMDYLVVTAMYYAVQSDPPGGFPGGPPGIINYHDLVLAAAKPWYKKLWRWIVLLISGRKRNGGA